MLMHTPAPVDSVLALIGNTPMVKLRRLSQGLPAEIWAKLEYNNPSGSVKDRIALRMIEAAERRGDIKPGATIVEPTSGNTGIALALVCTLKGYQMIAVMPEAMSGERRKLLALLGATVELVPCNDPKNGFTKEDIERTLQRAKDIVAKTPNAYLPNQFSNEDNPSTHAETTAREIMEQTGGRFHAFVTSSGTGGTFSGVARVLKQECPNVRRVVVEPARSAVMSGCEVGFHGIEGIGEGFIPDVMDMSLVDEIIPVDDNDAIAMARRCAREEGVLAGISGGANVAAAVKVAKTMEAGTIIVTIIPDSALRYCSTRLFEA